MSGQALQFIPLPLTDLTIYKVAGVIGDYIEMVLPQDVAESRMAARNVFVEGAVTFTRLEGTVPAGAEVVKGRGPGETTFDPQPYEWIPAGKIRMEVITPTFRYYCINHPGKKRLNGQLLRMQAGDTVEVQPGHWLFVALGKITLNGTEHIEAELIDVVDTAVTIQATEDAYVAQILKV